MAIAIYVRQSVEKENSISCETQVEHCKSKLNPSERKEKIIIFKDEGFTGANTNRDAFQKMMRMVEQDRISKIVVYKLDRISRSIIDYSKMLKIFKDHSVSFACAEDNIDTSNPMGEAMSKIVMIFAEMERDMISARVKSGMQNAAAKGKTIGRPTVTIENIPSIFLKYYPKYKSKEMNVTEISRLCEMSRTTVYKYIALLEK